MSVGLVSLEDFASVLRGAGFMIQFEPLAGREVLLAETPYELAACVEMDGWEGLREHVFDVQAAFTRFAGQAPSAKRWDLYLFVHVLRPRTDSWAEQVIEEIETDTRYARKYVRVAVRADEPQALQIALRPLLPLQSAAEFHLTEPLEALRTELNQLKLPQDVTDAALRSFSAENEVRVP